MNLDADIALAIRLADAAGEAIRPHFRSGVARERKDDATPGDRSPTAPPRRRCAASSPPKSRATRHRRGVRRDRGHLGPQLGARSDRRHQRVPRRPADLRHADRAGGRRLAGARRDRPADPRRALARRRRAADHAQRQRRRAPAPAASCPTPRSPPPARTTSTTRPTASTSWRSPRKTDHKRMVMGGDCYNYALLATGHHRRGLREPASSSTTSPRWCRWSKAPAARCATGTAIRSTPAPTATSSRSAIRRGSRTCSRRWPATTDAASRSQSAICSGPPIAAMIRPITSLGPLRSRRLARFARCPESRQQELLRLPCDRVQAPSRLASRRCP